MSAINIGVSHQDNPMIAELGRVKIIIEAGPQGSNDGPDFLMSQHLIRGCLFHIDDFAA
ncbi:hypothetical protein ES703_46436 [subsurface metagenome]